MELTLVQSLMLGFVGILILILGYIFGLLTNVIKLDYFLNALLERERKFHEKRRINKQKVRKRR